MLLLVTFFWDKRWEHVYAQLCHAHCQNDHTASLAHNGELFHAVRMLVLYVVDHQAQSKLSYAATSCEGMCVDCVCSRMGRSIGVYCMSKIG